MFYDLGPTDDQRTTGARFNNIIRNSEWRMSGRSVRLALSCLKVNWYGQYVWRLRVQAIVNNLAMTTTYRLYQNRRYRWQLKIEMTFVTVHGVDVDVDTDVSNDQEHEICFGSVLMWTTSTEVTRDFPTHLLDLQRYVQSHDIAIESIVLLIGLPLIAPLDPF